MKAVQQDMSSRTVERLRAGQLLGALIGPGLAQPALAESQNPAETMPGDVAFTSFTFRYKAAETLAARQARLARGPGKAKASVKSIVLVLASALALSACATGADHIRPAESPVRLKSALMESALQAFAAADAQQMPARCQILFVGSSSFTIWTDLDNDIAGPALNRGFGGSQISDINIAFSRVVAPYQPRAIVFYAGDNDIDAGADAETVVGRFRTFLDLKTRAMGKTPVYFVSIKPSLLRSAQFEEQTRANTRIRALADQRPDLVLIDVVEPMMLDGHLRPLFLQDGLHMNRDGYVIWAKAINDALARPMKARSPTCQKAAS